MRRWSFAAANGDEPFFDLPATERRRDNEHPTNGVGGRECSGYCLANCPGVAPDHVRWWISAAEQGSITHEDNWAGHDLADQGFF